MLCVFVETSPNYFEEIDDDSDINYNIIEDDVQSGYDGDVIFVFQPQCQSIR